MSRPCKYTDDKINDIADAMNKYIESVEIPIAAEFAWQNKIPKSTLYNLAEKSDKLLESIKRLTDKKEAQLERMCLNKEIEKTMAIFSLKQLGWKDKTEIDANLTVGINIVDDVKQCKNKSE